jgi:hypothetical protein
MILYARLLGLVLIALVGLGAGTAGASGSASASFGLQPVRYDPDRPVTASYFVYDAQPGQIIQDQVRVTNRGTLAGTVRLYPVDAATGQTSGTVYRGAADPRVDVGTWVTFDDGISEVTLAPGDARDLGFTVRVPADAAAGQHVGGLVAEDTQLRTGARTGDLAVTLQSRSVVAVQLNLPGVTSEQLTITGATTDVRQGYQMLVLSMRNDGTVILKPAGVATIMDAAGQELRRLSLQLDTVLPGSAIEYPIAVPGQALEAGSYQLVVDLTYGTQGRASWQSGLEITRRQAQQVTGSVSQQPPRQPSPAAASGSLDADRLLVLLPLALVLWVGAGCLVIVRRRHRRAAAAGSVATAMPSVPATIQRLRAGTRGVAIRQLGQHDRRPTSRDD